MARQFFESGSYKTEANAVKAVEAFLEGFEEEIKWHLRFQGGRFFPVLVLSRHQEWMVGQLAHAGKFLVTMGF